MYMCAINAVSAPETPIVAATNIEAPDTVTQLYRCVVKIKMKAESEVGFGPT